MLGGQAQGFSRPTAAGGPAPLELVTKRSDRAFVPCRCAALKSAPVAGIIARLAQGTYVPRQRCAAMTDPELRAQSFEIAWRYLDQSGLLTGEHKDSAGFILNRIDRMMLRGERRRLLLSNAAIDAYRLRPVLVSA